MFRRQRSRVERPRPIASPELWSTSSDGSLRSVLRGDRKFPARGPNKKVHQYPRARSIESVDDVVAVATMGLLATCGAIIGWALLVP
jgi:hypothetical protein